jgi:hypothetical protein
VRIFFFGVLVCCPLHRCYSFILPRSLLSFFAEGSLPARLCAQRHVIASRAFSTWRRGDQRLSRPGRRRSKLADGPPVASDCVTLACTVCRTCGECVLPSLRRSSSWVSARVTRLGCVEAFYHRLCASVRPPWVRSLFLCHRSRRKCACEVFLGPLQQIPRRVASVPSTAARKLFPLAKGEDGECY